MTSRENCVARLAEGRVQEKLAEAFAFYFDDLQDILTLASSLHDGERPENLSNEVFSCFHHLARGLCVSDADTSHEFDKAVGSHLKRATLDSYKMVLNYFLHADTKLRETLDYLVLVEDFEKYVPDGIAKINEINRLGEEVRNELRLGKKDESYGYFDQALGHFNTAVDRAIDLSKEIRCFTGNETYQLACAREARERRERKKDRWTAIIAAVVSAVLAAALTIPCTLAVQRWSTNAPAANTPLAPTQQTP